MKKIIKFNNIFWVLFILYFVFVHPFITYTPRSSWYLATTAPSEGLKYLALSIVLWTIILGFSFSLLIKYSFIAKKNIRYIQKNGVRLIAKIIEASPLNEPSKGIQLMKIVLELNNLEGDKIRESMHINDSKPDLRRYEVGQSLYLRVDDTFKRTPFYILEDSRSKVRWILFVIWIICLIGVFMYYNYAYISENQGYGWRFLDVSHPLIFIPFMILMFTLIVVIIFKFFTGKNTQTLKWKGKKVNARIIQLSQTGVLINDQPEVQFYIEFNDKNGILRQTSIKKIVSLIDIGNLKNETEKTIFYDPQDPSQAVFEEDIYTSEEFEEISSHNK